MDSFVRQTTEFNTGDYVYMITTDNTERECGFYEPSMTFLKYPHRIKVVHFSHREDKVCEGDKGFVIHGSDLVLCSEYDAYTASLNAASNVPFNGDLQTIIQQLNQELYEHGE